MVTVSLAVLINEVVTKLVYDISWLALRPVLHKHRSLPPGAMDVATLKVVVVGNNCSGEYHLHVS
jgi:hypothetical protein